MTWTPADLDLATQSTAEWEIVCQRQAALVARLKAAGADARLEEAVLAQCRWILDQKRAHRDRIRAEQEGNL
ncbi:hypothetical protein [Methylobacterium nodulans]|uniref:hypothetical protein n=1 Tax=Methylobacterium nodulans TaxID=114616 RepID=UPI00031576DE|nr:hypothetical protein [Methylobacterium nodulans]